MRNIRKYTFLKWKQSLFCTQNTPVKLNFITVMTHADSDQK